MNPTPFTNEELEAAAVSAEEWQEHGDRKCEDHWLNKGGFP